MRQSLALCTLALFACPARESATKRNNPAPNMTSISPTEAMVGDGAFEITVNGHAFVDGSSVLWNGAVRPTKFESGIRLIAKIGAADLATGGEVAVTVLTSPPGGGASDAKVFTVKNPAPVLTSLSPTSGTAGSAATVHATGEHFVKSSVLQLAGKAVRTQVTSATDLTADLPSELLVAGSLPIAVVTPGPGGGGSAVLPFEVGNPLPMLAALSPTSATAGDSSFVASLIGSGFVAASSVRWNGNARTSIFVDTNHLLVSIETADLVDPGTASITVFNGAPGGGTSAAQLFAIHPGVPSITALNPASGMAGSGLTLTVLGARFVPTSVVQWSGADHVAGFKGSGELTAAILASEMVAGSANVTVKNPGGLVSAVAAFSITNPVPLLKSLDPSATAAGGGDLALTAIGDQFVNGSSIVWNGTPLLTTFVDASHLTAVVPTASLTVGTFTVTVSTPVPGGGSSLGLPFAVTNPVPTTSLISPTSATLGDPSIQLQIFGTGFVKDTVAWLGDTPLVSTVVNSTQIVASVPSLTPAAVWNVKVTNPAPGGGDSNTQTFTMNNPSDPTTTKLFAAGLHDNGSSRGVLVGSATFTLTVTGARFGTGATVVWDFNHQPQSLATQPGSLTQLTATVPAQLVTKAGWHAISVTNPAPGGGTSANKNVPFELVVWNPNLTLTSLTPSAGTAGASDFTITVAGTNFVQGASAYLPTGMNDCPFGYSSRPMTVATNSVATFVYPGCAMKKPGTYQIQFSNPGPCCYGGYSDSRLDFTVNPTPVIGTLSPFRVTVGSAGFTLLINAASGSFLPGATASWSGSPRTTTFVSATQLSIPVTAQDVAAAGAFDVTVQNPAPSGTTAPSTFVVNNPAMAVSAGVDHACALSTSGGVKCWGDNYRGKLGDNSQNSHLLPESVLGLTSGVSLLATGGSVRWHNCVALAAGGVQCWGFNGAGEIGDNSKTDRWAPVAVLGLTDQVTALSVSQYQSCALTASGGVKCWGAMGAQSSIVPVDVMNGATAIAAGSSAACALTTAGGVQCWGENISGQLGDNTTITRSVPADVVGLTTGVTAIAASNDVADFCAVTAAGGLKCWGSSSSVITALSNRSLKPIDVLPAGSSVAAAAIGGSGVCILTSSGALKCWGKNGAGEIGDGTTVSRATPVDVLGLTSGVSSFALGPIHACAVTADGGVLCWGGTSDPQTRPSQILGTGVARYSYVPVAVHF